ncbi:unnamed protein product [Heligmosomoides polygyrus]|uniref:Ribosome biogenesis protein NOP53 n=1 Tax=Heligmosomoides polygyrus TaxID=6339 RepID=A0A183G9J7_HELPZ|nr:unnamed protein product [Heligmosomoides polygyrus]
MTDEGERKAAKRAKSEEQRLASIRAKKELEKQRNAIVAQALREVDQKRKRVVFSDSEGEEVSRLGVRCSLGEKLMKLEARFNSDSRFKLDEKFVSSGSDDEDESEVVQERAKNLEVLSKVLGNTGSSGHPKARPFTRFDPFNEEHVRWVMKEEVSVLNEKAQATSVDFPCNTASSSRVEVVLNSRIRLVAVVRVVFVDFFVVQRSVVRENLAKSSLQQVEAVANRASITTNPAKVGKNTGA